MTNPDAEKPHIELLPATLEQQPILANLLELYMHDFSQFLPLELGSDGRFGYSNLSAYWREPDRHPFLVRVDGDLAGFVLIKRGSGISGDSSVWDMAEFFIVRGHRRKGIATKIARDVWTRFPGRWEIRVMESNQPARSFWEHAIHQFTGQTTPSACVQINAQNWHLFSFESKQD